MSRAWKYSLPNTIRHVMADSEKNSGERMNIILSILRRKDYEHFMKEFLEDWEHEWEDCAEEDDVEWADSILYYFWDYCDDNSIWVDW